jgi:hypothetical protein
LVSAPIWSSFLVEVFNGGPTPRSGIVTSTNGRVAQVDVSKRNIGIPLKGRGDGIPCRGLFSSSASSFRSDPTNKERPVLNLRLDRFFKDIFRQLLHMVPMVLSINGRRCDNARRRHEDRQETVAVAQPHCARE